jgi:hypothetical protein
VYLILPKDGFLVNWRVTLSMDRAAVDINKYYGTIYLLAILIKYQTDICGGWSQLFV